MTPIGRRHAGCVARLTRLLGDFDLAEELVQEAIVSALEHWPKEGVPDAPAAWLLTVARRKGIDRLRREARYQRKLALLEREPQTVSVSTDDRLDLIFTCCHPALPRDAQVALTLRSVVGLTTSEIASAFLVPEATLAQRIVRAKRKIVEAHIAFRAPDLAEIPERLTEVLTVLYLVFNEGYLSSGAERAARRDLAEEAEWLASLVVRLLPAPPRTAGDHRRYDERALDRLRFIRAAQAVGLTLGGIVGTIAAFPLVKTLGDHLTLMRWVVTGVIAYAAIAMLRSARASQPDAPVPTVPE